MNPTTTTVDTAPEISKLTDYFAHRLPFKGDEVGAKEAAEWAWKTVNGDKLAAAVLLLEATNDRNSLQRRLRTVGIIASNSDFLEIATKESVEWAIGGPLKPDKTA